MERKLICNLKQIMKEKGITQKELCEKTGISIRSMSRYVNNERIPDTETAFNLAEAADVSIMELFTKIE